MPGERCAVAVCNNSRVKTRELSDNSNKVFYHRFPKDQALSKQWENFCKRADKSFNPLTSVICSDHFTSESYERDLKAELLNLVPKKTLKPNAVPTLFSCSKTATCVSLDHGEMLSSERDKRVKSRDCKKVVESILNNEFTENEASSEAVGLNESTDMKEILLKENSDLKEKLALLQNKIDLDCREIKKLKKDNQNLKRKNNKLTAGTNKAHKVLKSIFTKNQIDLLLGLKKNVAWTSDEISLAFTLRYLSKRCYLFIKRKMKIPLPGLSTLQRWASRFVIDQGLFVSVFKYLEVASSSFKEHERVIVLQFDEIKVKKVMEYDSKNDQIVGPHSQMQVVSARGLFANWKQPLYVKFDTQITKEILSTIIVKLKESGYTVKACVSDMGGGNVGLWKQLEISTKKTYFVPDPSSDEKVYLFADAPHVLKLIRNWFLDTGFKLSSEHFVHKEPVSTILKMEENNDLKVCHKLTTAHLTVQKAERQNVRKASELMSHTTATALTHYLRNDKVAQSTSSFIELVNKWFDLMNSYSPRQFGEPSQRAYGQDLVNQNEILDEMLTTMTTMRCCGKNSLQSFQKGCIISIMSLKELLKDLKTSYDIKYILTHRLNQDCLEDLFSQIRTRGGLNDHPTPLDAIYRLRMIILGKTQGLLQQNTNTNNNEDTSETIVSKVLRVAGVKVVETETTCPRFNEERFSVEMTNNELPCTPGPSNDSVDCKNDALEYLSGWVAKKLKISYPYLAKVQDEDNATLPEISLHDSWIKHLSYGGLTRPSPEWLNQAKLMNEEFELYHKNDLCKEPGVVKRITMSAIQKYPCIPEEVARSFIKQRTLIRMKFLNEKLTLKRKPSGPVSEDRKTLKKYKKLTT